jgi:hypothetical protein
MRLHFRFPLLSIALLEYIAGMVHEWHAIFDTLKPALFIFDLSPTTLLAARGYPFKKVLI